MREWNTIPHSTTPEYKLKKTLKNEREREREREREEGGGGTKCS